MTRSSIIALAAALSAFGSAHAGTLQNDPFTFQLGTASGVRPVIGGIAGLKGFDIAEDSGGTTVEVDWVDGDTVDVAFLGGFSDDAAGLFYELAGLDFLEAGLPVPITGVTFDRAGSGIDGLLGNLDLGQPPANAFVEPSITFTDTSFTATFASFDLRLIGDGPRLRYDVATGSEPPPVVPDPGPSPAPIPVPAAGFALLGGLAALGALRRRR